MENIAIICVVWGGLCLLALSPFIIKGIRTWNDPMVIDEDDMQ